MIYSKPKLSCEIDIHQEVEKKTRLQTLERKRAVNEAKSKLSNETETLNSGQSSSKTSHKTKEVMKAEMNFLTLSL